MHVTHAGGAETEGLRSCKPSALSSHRATNRRSHAGECLVQHKQPARHLP